MSLKLQLNFFSGQLSDKLLNYRDEKSRLLHHDS